jgi:predicted enzyme related to lactoylglutathione lyase
MTATTITDVRSVAVPVGDQDAAIGFYVGTLGFEKRLDAPISETMRWIEVAPPGAATSIALASGPDSPTPGVDTGVRFTVADVEAEHRRLRDGGVATSELLAWEDVPPMFTFDDPDGNRFYVIADPDGRPGRARSDRRVGDQDQVIQDTRNVPAFGEPGITGS